MEPEFVKLELHGKLEFHKLKFKKNGRFLIISQTVIDPYIFCQRVVLGQNGRENYSKIF